MWSQHQTKNRHISQVRLKTSEILLVSHDFKTLVPGFPVRKVLAVAVGMLLVSLGSLSVQSRQLNVQ